MASAVLISTSHRRSVCLPYTLSEVCSSSHLLSSSPIPSKCRINACCTIFFQSFPCRYNVQLYCSFLSIGKTSFVYCCSQLIRILFQVPFNFSPCVQRFPLTVAGILLELLLAVSAFVTRVNFTIGIRKRMEESFYSYDPLTNRTYTNLMDTLQNHVSNLSDPLIYFCQGASWLLM